MEQSAINRLCRNKNSNRIPVAPATHRYRNPWHKPGKPHYGPPEYQTDAQPVEYRGFLIFQRIPGHCWDVVRGGVCVTQRAGPNGARSAIDALAEKESANV